VAEVIALFAVGGAIVAGVGLGTRYINAQLRLDDTLLSGDVPIVRSRPNRKDHAPQHP
jgi:hypothetical protein